MLRGASRCRAAAASMSSGWLKMSWCFPTATEPP